MVGKVPWDYQPTADSRVLPVPEDGIVASQRPLGWVGEAWRRLVESYTGDHAPRVARGRGFARAGRVRALSVDPGQAVAECVASQGYRVAVRLPVFDPKAWDRVIEVLAQDLARVAELLEGKLALDLVRLLESKGRSLLPKRDELDGDCDCGDFLLPCAHMVAVHYVLADALDGDPFLLLTLRGRTMDQVLAGLRKRWGDPSAGEPVNQTDEEAPPDWDDWDHHPVPLVPLQFVVEGGSPTSGLMALGPAPGGLDLQRAVQPLYAAGADRATAVLMAEPTTGDNRRRRMLFTRRRDLAPKEDLSAPKAVPEVPQPVEEIDPVEMIVDALAQNDGAKSTELSELLQLDPLIVRNELIGLEELGIVYRTGRTRGTRWFLG